jgi:hypothetical protein
MSGYHIRKLAFRSISSYVFAQRQVPRTEASDMPGPSLEFLAAQVARVLDELHGVRAEMRGFRAELADVRDELTSLSGLATALIAQGRRAERRFVRLEQRVSSLGGGARMMRPSSFP